MNINILLSAFIAYLGYPFGKVLATIAKEELGMTVESRPIHLMNEIDTFEEMGACGTAAVLSPVGKILVDNQWHKFYEDGEAVGPVMQKLYDLLTQMQKGEREDPYGWTVKVC